MAEQAFADEEVVDAGVAQAGDVVGSFDAALGDDRAAGRDQGGQALGDREVGAQRAEVAVVDADQGGVAPQRAVELGFVVYLDEDFEAQRAGLGGELGQLSAGESGGDEKDAVRTCEAGFDDLVGIQDEVLAEDGQRNRGACGLQVGEGALELGVLGENGEAGGAGARVSAG